MVTVQVPALSCEPGICNGLQVVVDAAGAAGWLTIRTVSPLRATSVQVPSSSTTFVIMPSTSSTAPSPSQSADVMNGVTVFRVTTGDADGDELVVGPPVGAADVPGAAVAGVDVLVPGDGATIDGSTTLVATGDGCGSGSSSEQDVSVSRAASPAAPRAQMRRCRCMLVSPRPPTVGTARGFEPRDARTRPP